MPENKSQSQGGGQNYDEDQCSCQGARNQNHSERNQGQKQDILKPDIAQHFRPVFLKTQIAMMQSAKGIFNISDRRQAFA